MAINYLHNHPDFADVIRIVGEERSNVPALVEKDYLEERVMSGITQFKYIDIFAGCGGLSLGLYNTRSWKGLFAIEKSPDAFLTLQHNLINKFTHFDWPAWLPKKEHDINRILDQYSSELKTLRNKVDLVTGGPPCQGFSSAGPRLENDERNQLIKSYVSFIRLVQPRIIFFENVKGFSQKFEKNKTDGKAYSQYILNALNQDGDDYLGYEVIGQLVDFSDYGVPQKRTRFILVGIRKDIGQYEFAQNFFKMIAKDKNKFLMSKGLSVNTNLEDAISDLLVENKLIACPDSSGFHSSTYKAINSSYQKYMRKGVQTSTPDSHRLANHREETISLFNNLIIHTVKGRRVNKEEKTRFGIKKRSLVVFSPKEPTPTLTTHPDDYIHYCEPRILTVREYARVQTFPDSFEFKGKYTTGGELRIKEVPRYSQVGNAIPPLFGELAGNVLKDLLVSYE